MSNCEGSSQMKKVLEETLEDLHLVTTIAEGATDNFGNKVRLHDLVLRSGKPNKIPGPVLVSSTEMAGGGLTPKHRHTATRSRP
jgi:hypothetical protein